MKNYQKNFELAELRYTQFQLRSYLSIPGLGIVLVICYALNQSFIRTPGFSTGLIVSALGLLLNILFLIYSKPNPLHYFPKFEVGDVVLFNPLGDGKTSDPSSRKYKFSQEHPQLNLHLPRHIVTAVGETTLVISRDGEDQELKFSQQNDLFLQQKAVAKIIEVVEEVSPRLERDETLI